MPGLASLLYAPQHSYGETKRLREANAGNPAMQQQLVKDDRYWMGRGMTEQAPALGSLALAGSIPYDAMKLAYFHGPKPLKHALASLSGHLFPGEAFNDRTTSRPSWGATLALLQGVVDGY